MEIALSLLYIVFFLWIIRKSAFFLVPGLSRRAISLLFLLKVVAGVAVWAIYTFYYTDRLSADIYKYFDDSKILYEIFFRSPAHFFRILSGIGNSGPRFDPYYSSMHYWARSADAGIYNDSHTIIRFNALLRFISMGYYQVHSIVLNFFSLLGLVALYKFFIQQLPDKKGPLIIAVFLLPSVLFWGSGVLKEGILFFATGMLLLHLTRLFSFRSVLWVTGMMALLAFSKFYVWVTLIPGCLFLIWDQSQKKPAPGIKLLLVLLMVSLVGLNIDKFSNFQHPLVTLAQKQHEFFQLANGELKDANNNPIPAAKSRIDIPVLAPTLSSFVKNAPQAIVTSLLRPFPSEVHGMFMIMAALETWLLLLILFLSVYFVLPVRRWNIPLLLFCLSFVLLQLLIIGETTPILGAVVRYRCIALPFLAAACISILDSKKLRYRLQKCLPKSISKI